MIRQATKKDLPTLMELARKFHTDAAYELPCTDDTLQLQLRNLLLHPQANLFVYEKEDQIVGVAGGPLAPWPYDINTSVLQEYLVCGEYTRRLKLELYKWAANLGASAVVMLCVDEAKGPRVRTMKEVL